jgi:hypothetical protein
MGKEFGERARSWTYRYNQRNPTIPAYFGVAHAAENWMMFKGTDTGYVTVFIFFQSYSSKTLVLTDRLLSLK